MRLLSLAFSFGWTEVAKPPSRRQGRAFLHLARFLLLYLFLLLPAPRSPVDNLLPPLFLLLSSLLDSLAAQCSLPNILPPLPPLSPLFFARSLFFIVSFFPLLYLLFSHLFNVSRQPPAFLAFSVRVYTSASNNRNCASSMKDSTHIRDGSCLLPFKKTFIHAILRTRRGEQVATCPWKHVEDIYVFYLGVRTAVLSRGFAIIV